MALRLSATDGEESRELLRQTNASLVSVVLMGFVDIKENILR